jgi:hypothetical protein
VPTADASSLVSQGVKLSLPLRAYRGRHRRPATTGIVDEANEVLLDTANPGPSSGRAGDLADVIPFAASADGERTH